VGEGWGSGGDVREDQGLKHRAATAVRDAPAAPQLVAEWAGHSVHVLLKVYARCTDGQDDAAGRRIEAALSLGGDR
jgi:hypothetical protein